MAQNFRLLRPEPIFTPDEIKENELKKQKLIDLLISGDGILMAGSGCNTSIYPDWTGLVQLLNQEAITINTDFPLFDASKDDFLNFADKVKECIGDDRYYSLIYRCFTEKGRTHEKYHESLCKLLIDNRLRGITTTNYDPVFENALAAVTGKAPGAVWIDPPNIEEARICEFLMSINGGSIPKRIFHIHGVCHQKGSIVLTESEYRSKYGFMLRQPPGAIFERVRQNGITEQQFSELLNDYGLVWTMHRKILWSFFATRRLIFLGFSLNDPYFIKMLEFVGKDLHTYGFDMHLLVLRIRSHEEKNQAKARARRLKDQFGIETIFFEESEEGTGLENFIYEIEKAVLGSSHDVDIREVKIVGHVVEDDEEITRKLIDLSKKR